MTRFDFLLYAIGFILVGFTVGVAAGAAYYSSRINPILNRIGGREETL